MTQYEELKSIISKQEKEIAALKAKLDKVDTYIYNYIDDNMPKWAKPTIKKLVDKGVLVGDDNGLNLNKIMMRILVILDRIGIFGEWFFIKALIERLCKLLTVKKYCYDYFDGRDGIFGCNRKSRNKRNIFNYHIFLLRNSGSEGIDNLT